MQPVNVEARPACSVTQPRLFPFRAAVRCAESLSGVSRVSCGDVQTEGASPGCQRDEVPHTLYGKRLF